MVIDLIVTATSVYLLYSTLTDQDMVTLIIDHY
jgi:hypothetical protein